MKRILRNRKLLSVIHLLNYKTNFAKSQISTNQHFAILRCVSCRRNRKIQPISVLRFCDVSAATKSQISANQRASFFAILEPVYRIITKKEKRKYFIKIFYERSKKKDQKTKIAKCTLTESIFFAFFRIQCSSTP